MEFNLESAEGHFIKSYRKGRIEIGETAYDKSLIIAKTTIISNWLPNDIKEITAAALEQIKKLSPAIVIVGVGETYSPLPDELLAPFLCSGIGVEVMTTASACRTYNVLLSENRQVAAGLII